MGAGLSASEPAAAAIARHRWWHSIEVAPGVVTPGAWDLRHLPARIAWPEELRGGRCLDVGTMDGFWAFEMERRGAAEVVAIDIADPTDMDLPRALRRSAERGDERTPGRPGESAADGFAERVEPEAARIAPAVGPKRRDAFNTAAGLLGSNVLYRELSIYDLAPAEVGRFDLVFVGYMLPLLRDPMGALEKVRSVCREGGAVIVLDEVSTPLSLLHPRTPLARVAAREGVIEWLVFNAWGLRRAVEIAGFPVDWTSGLLRYRRGPGIARSEVPLRARLSYALGLRGRSLAVRGRTLA